MSHFLSVKPWEMKQIFFRHTHTHTHQGQKVILLIQHAMSDPFSKKHNCTNHLASPSLQDDCSTAGMFDPILATLEVYPLPAEALEGVQTRTGCSQEDRHKTSPTATEERLTWVLTPAQTDFIIRWHHLLISTYRRVRQRLSHHITVFRNVAYLLKTSFFLPSFPAFLICPNHAECLTCAALVEILTSHLCLPC